MDKNDAKINVNNNDQEIKDIEDDNLLIEEAQKHGTLNGIRLERGDAAAIMIAALTTMVPFVLIIFFIYFVVIKLFFRL